MSRSWTHARGGPDEPPRPVAAGGAATDDSARWAIGRRLRAAVRQLRLGRAAGHAVLSEAQRRALVEQVCEFLIRGELDAAQREVERARQACAYDAACLNLLGVIHEARGQWPEARRCYGRAVRADRRYAPARQNLRRWYELTTLGQTTESVSLGNLAADLRLARYRAQARPAKEKTL